MELLRPFYLRAWKLTALIAVIFPSFCQAELNTNTGGDQLMCQVEPGYMGGSGTIDIEETSRSCFVDHHYFLQNQQSYQLVDVREDKSNATLPSSLRISLRSLQYKKTFKGKKLVLLDSGFSRARAVNWCGRLKKAGFSSVKFLLGGEVAYRKGLQITDGYRVSKAVSALDVLYEWSSGYVHLVTLGQGVDTKLKELGLDSGLHFDFSEANDIKDLLPPLVSGYHTVVLVGETDAISAQALENIDSSNIYYLKGGISELNRSIKDKASIARGRDYQAVKKAMCSV